MTRAASFDLLAALLESADPAERANGEAFIRDQELAHPGDALVHYQIGSACDSAGRESQAWPHYERALAIGVEHLPADRQPEIFVQAGSTLRNLERFDDARQLLRDGIARFPAYRALPVFLALLEASLGDRTAASALLFDVIAMDDDASLARYRRSLRWYVDELAGRHAAAAG